MSLTMKRTVNLVGTSLINETPVERYNANIDSDNPENLNYAPMIQDKELYKENRDECHKDQAAFENIMYAVQDEMIKAKATTEEDIENEDDNN